MIGKPLEDKVNKTISSALEAEEQKAKSAVDPATKKSQEQEDLEGLPTAREQLEESLGLPEETRPQAEPEPVRVAGFGTALRQLGKATARRTTEAERRVTMSTNEPPPVQEVGNTLQITPADPDEIKRINQQLGGEYTKGLNMPEILRVSGDFDAADYMSRFKDANAELFENARRGKIGFDDMLAMAEARGFDDVVYNLMKRKPGETLPPEDFLAGMLAHTQLMQQARRQWEVALEMPKGPDKDAAMNQALALSTAHSKVATSVSATSSEAGRTLQISGEMGRRGIPQVTEELTLFGAETAEEIEVVGRRYLSITDPKAQRRFVEKGLTAKSMDVMAEIFINSILSSPITHMINIAGNSSFSGIKTLETFYAAGFGRARSKLTGSADRVRAQEGIARIEGIRRSLLDAVLVAGKSFATETPVSRGSKIDARTRRAIGTTGNPKEILEMARQGDLFSAAVNAYGSYTRMPGRFLMAEDEFFKAIESRGTLYQQAQIRASKMYDETIAGGGTVEEAKRASALERASIIENPPESVRIEAETQARTGTFTEQLGPNLENLQRAVSHPLAKLFVPFFTTPVNIMKSTLTRTPLMLAYPGFYKTIRRGGREADMAMAKVAVGSTIMSGFAYSSFGFDGEDKSTIIVGKGPSDPEARQAMRRQGFQPYSINILQDDGSYKSLTYSRFDPLSGLLAMAADFAYYAQYEDDQNKLDQLSMAATLSTASYMMEMPLLQGASELQVALMQPNPADKFDALSELLGEKVTQAGLAALPGSGSAARALTRTQDPTLRETQMLPEEGMLGEDITEMPSVLRGFYRALEQAKAGNPLFNDDVPPRLNLWGEEIKAGKGYAWEFISPVRVQDARFKTVDEEMVRLGDGISRTPRKIDGVLLNRKERNNWIKLTNEIDQFGRLPSNPKYDVDTTLLVDLNRLIGSQQYQDLPTDDDRLRILKNAVSQRRSAARKLLLQQDIDLNKKVEAAK